jgi:Mg2+ and Co2+ transporter CorA
LEVSGELLLIRVYSVKEKELVTTDVKSQKEMSALAEKVERAWVDCWDCNDDETMVISKLLGVEATTLSGIENGKVRPGYAKCRDEECPYYTWISTPVVEFAGELKLHPLSIILKERFVITLRTGYSSRIIDAALRRFRTLRLEERKPSVTLVGLVSEIIDENSLGLVSIRAVIDQIEEKALEKPRIKEITQSIFKLKRELSTLQQLFWAEKELLSDLTVGVIPRLRLAPEAKPIIEESVDDINGELEIVDSYNTSLDSILRLQDLGLIHKVETNIVYLTVSLVALTIILILLEIAARMSGA